MTQFLANDFRKLLDSLEKVDGKVAVKSSEIKSTPKTGMQTLNENQLNEFRRLYILAGMNETFGDPVADINTVQPIQPVHEEGDEEIDSDEEVIDGDDDEIMPGDDVDDVIDDETDASIDDMSSDEEPEEDSIECATNALHKLQSALEVIRKELSGDSDMPMDMTAGDEGTDINSDAEGMDQDSSELTLPNGF
jgi:hypothetical protein